MQFCSVFGALVYSSHALKSTTPIVVPIEGGEVRGFIEASGRAVFRGLPYAAPPVGDLRWRPPKPAEPWAPKVLNASKFGPACAQLGPAWTTLVGEKTSSEVKIP